MKVAAIFFILFSLIAVHVMAQTTTSTSTSTSLSTSTTGKTSTSTAVSSISETVTTGTEEFTTITESNAGQMVSPALINIAGVIVAAAIYIAW